MKNIEAPNNDEFNELYKESIFIQKKVFVKLKKFYKALSVELHTEEPRQVADREEIFDFFIESTNHEFYNALGYKITHSIKSLVMVNFYKAKIKSDKYWISDDFQTLPDYERNDRYTKDWFDYFSDNFFIQISSSFDLLGNILNNFLKLHNPKPDFECVINCLNQKTIGMKFGKDKLQIFDKIRSKIQDAIIKNPVYVEYKILRNDTIHNIAHSIPFQKVIIKRDSDKNITETSIMPTYLKSEDRIEIMNTMSNLFLNTLDIFISEIPYSSGCA